MTPLRAALAAAVAATDRYLHEPTAIGCGPVTQVMKAMESLVPLIRDHGPELLALLDERDALRQDAVSEAAMALYAARADRKFARDALIAYRMENGVCESGQGCDCFRERQLPQSDWCSTCQGSQPLWIAYRKACSRNGAALRTLMLRCKRYAARRDGETT